MATEIIIRDYEDEYGNLNVIGNGNLSASVVVPQIEAAKGQPLTVKIASVGGSVFNGLAIYNALISHGDVTTINEGYAMSIAALISMAGKSRKTYSSSMFMVHKASAFAFGGMNADDMRREASALDVADSIMIDVFSGTTGISKSKMESLLSDETFYTGYDAHQLGFFTELVNGETQAIAKTSYDKITANQPLRMVALMDRTLKIKDNSNMSEITELRAQHEENKGLFAQLKEFLGIKAQADKPEETVTETETKEVVTEKPAVEEVPAKSAEDLQKENEELKTKLSDAEAKAQESAQALSDAKAMMAETKNLLAEVKSNYKPAAKGEDFDKSEATNDASAKFVKPKKK